MEMLPVSPQNSKGKWVWPTCSPGEHPDEALVAVVVWLIIQCVEEVEVVERGLLLHVGKEVQHSLLVGDGAVEQHL